MLYPETKVSKELARSMFEQQKDFHYDFGMSWDNIARIWDKLHFPISRINVRGEELEHLLWTLLFAKVYTSECITKKLVGKSPKMVRKCAWIFLEEITNLSSEVVSKN
jgi:hypothetical protein